MMNRSLGILAFTCFAILVDLPWVSAADVPPNYATQIKPLLTKYCTGCHNDGDAEGELSLDSFAALQKGGEHGPAILAGNASASRMVRMLTGKAKPVMPPEDEPQPKAAEVALITRWVDAGALGPQGEEPDRTRLLVPKLEPSPAKPAITAVAVSPDGNRMAVASFRSVEIRDAKTNDLLRKVTESPGKVNDLRFSADSRRLVMASGIAGLYGQAIVADVDDPRRSKEFKAHRDTLYAATLSKDAKVLATGSYDRKIVLWDVATGKRLHALDGHNGAIYDLAFSPDGQHLASASGDGTIKIWSVATGKRLDTRSEPLKEMYTVDFSPDGKHFVAAGADNRIRMWRFISRQRPAINPQIHARYGHEGGITRLQYTDDGKQIVTAALDRSVKVWNALGLSEVRAYPDQPDTIEALAVDSVGRRAVVGRMNGSIAFLALPKQEARTHAKIESPVKESFVDTNVKPSAVIEKEPNDTPQLATKIDLPSSVQGTIDSQDRPGRADADLYRFSSKAGQVWIFEVNAARNKSPLDSKIEILDLNGAPVPRVKLQAVRESYFTFRGKNSDQSDDFRIHGWEEMALNEYLYAHGEVVRLYHYPRGPDSGFRVYPGFGTRRSFFGTTSLSHALGEACYVVQPYAANATIVPNGLPVFTINYENDDDGRRKLGKDSRLRFVAPHDGEYLVRVRDVRGFEGDKFSYTLSVRPPNPDFRVRVSGMNPTVHAGSGRKIQFTLDRVDEFRGPVELNLAGLPPGFSMAGPLFFEAGQDRVFATLFATADAPSPTKDNHKKSTIVATATINGKKVQRNVGSLGEIKLGKKPKLFVTITADSGAQTEDKMPLLKIPAGGTIKCVLQVERNGHNGVIGFGKEEAALNLPHGVYVDRTGLNGVLLLGGQNERDVFITAEPWVAATERPIFFEAAAAERPTSPPAMVRVVGPDE